MRLEIQLLDSNYQPFACNKNAPYGSALSCPVVGIHFKTAMGTITTYPTNDNYSVWVAGECNSYHSIFTVTAEMARAHAAYFTVKGAAPHISIIIDNLIFRGHTLFTRNCRQLIRNTNAEVS